VGAAMTNINQLEERKEGSKISNKSGTS